MGVRETRDRVRREDDFLGVALEFMPEMSQDISVCHERRTPRIDDPW